MKDRLVAGLLTPLTLADASSAARFLEILVRRAPALSPEVYGHFEPPKTPFSSVELTAASWKPPFLWRHLTGGRVDGAAWFANPGHHSAAYVTANGTRPPTDDAVALIQEAAVALSLDFAYVHLITDAETKAPGIAYDMWYPFDIGVTSQDLKKGIPGVCWAMIFGPPYVRLIGRETLQSAPCFAAKELSGEHVYLQLTARIDDVRDDFDRFERVRQQIKAHLGTTLFLEIPPGDSARVVPEFAHSL